MQFSCFLPVLPGSAEAQIIWAGIVKYLLIAYFISNISAKKYQNPFTYVKVIASQRWDVFWDTLYIDARDEGTAVPNGVRLPPITTTSKASTSASVEASKRPRAHEKDKYDFYLFHCEESFRFVFLPCACLRCFDTVGLASGKVLGL